MSSMTDGESSYTSPKEEALQLSPEVDSPPDNMLPQV
jgi:hypothetical protein